MSSNPAIGPKLEVESQPKRWIGWCALPAFVVVAFSVRALFLPWEFMWTLSVAIFGGLKWMTWWNVGKQIPHSSLRSTGYLLAWPGMDVEAFLDERRRVLPPVARAWIWAVIKTLAGISFLFVIARAVPPRLALVQGWVGMVGLILLLHFGSFELIALLWQGCGIDAQPIMNAPLRSTSVAEFWGRRWNLGFRQLSYDLIFKPAAKRWGPVLAGFFVFVASGLLHDLVISVPARGGYGLPTGYFIIQGLAVAFERSRLGKNVGIRQGPGGWIFTAVLTAGPAFLLFHPPFVIRVIIPFMRAIHAL